MVAVIGLVLVAIWLTGCAGFKAPSAASISMGNFEGARMVKVEKNGVEVSAFAVKTEEESRRYFDENLLKDGVLAIHLDIVSRTSDEGEILSSDLRVGKDTIPSSSSGIAYEAAKRVLSWRAIAWGLPTYFVGSAISAVHTSNVNKEIKKDLEEKSLLESDVKIKPFGASQGFVWFKMPEKDLPKGMVLNLFLALGKDRKVVKYEVPIPD